MQRLIGLAPAISMFTVVKNKFVRKDVTLTLGDVEFEVFVRLDTDTFQSG